MDKEYILCAAIWVDDGIEYPHQPVNIKTGLVFCAHRHHNVFVLIEKAYPMGERVGKTGEMAEQLAGKNQGFLTSIHRYVGRCEANTIAIEAGQVTHDRDKHLFSEDLY